MIIHSGHYRPVDAPDTVPGQNEILGSIKNTTSFTKVISPILSQVTPIVAQADSVLSSATTLVPDHDLKVTLRVLPRLIRYTGSKRYGLDSKYDYFSCTKNLGDGDHYMMVKVYRLSK